MKEWKLSMNQTELSMTPAGDLYKEYCFSDSERPAEKACIGHLRGDFGLNGEAFYTSFWTHNKSLLTDCFRQELDDVVNALRKNGLLANRAEMRAHLNRFPEAVLHTEWANPAAFRIDTKNHIFFLRCLPIKGDYNFYLYCYERTAMLEVMRKQQGLPVYCWSVLPSTKELILLRYGETGYYRQGHISCVGMTTRQMADELNEQHGMTKAQVAAMECGSMHGWSVPGADPKQYDERGYPRRNHENERTEER